jgi:hypothetical protein
MGFVFICYFNILAVAFVVLHSAKKGAECNRLCYILFPFGERSIELIERSRTDRQRRYPNGCRYPVL